MAEYADAVPSRVPGPLLRALLQELLGEGLCLLAASVAQSPVFAGCPSAALAEPRSRPALTLLPTKRVRDPSS